MRYLAAALLAAFFCFSGLPALAATTGIVRGNVIVNGTPQAGVLVTIRGEGTQLQAKTDAKGNYIFSQVPFGHYTVVAQAAGVAETTQVIDVASDSLSIVNLQLGTLKTIAATRVTSTGGTSGYPVSQNSLGRQQITSLPVNNSLDRILETVPGIVRFSYNEPVAHGFHGVSYEMDGAPIPIPTSSNFAEIVDPKNVDSVEIFTGAMPAEFGGSRQGAVVNMISTRPSDITVPYQGYVSGGVGNYGQGIWSLDQSIKAGQTAFFINANSQHSQRGLDTPTYNPIHDDSSQSDQFFRSITDLGHGKTLAFDYSNQFAQFQIPINTDPNNPIDPQVSVPGTDDVQREYDRFANLNFTSVSKDGNGIFQVIPWYRYTRIAYGGDLANDVKGLFNNGDGTFTPNIGLRQDRSATYAGLRVSQFRASKHHAVKVGLDADRENFTATQTFACYSPDCSTFPAPPPPAPGYYAFNSNQAQAGSQLGFYAEDKWSPSKAVTVSYGLRYDHSTGYVSGNQVSPRIGVNIAADSKNILHFYYGRFYAAPQLEDVRADCVILQGCASEPVYNLKPETDSYYEMGVAHVFDPRTTGYLNYWSRNASNVLDTTQLLNTPLFAVFNNAVGQAQGLEARLVGRTGLYDQWFFSGTMSMAQAAGVSGSTFLFPPDQLGGTLQPEDHDQTYAVNAAYTHRFGWQHAFYSTLQTEYGTGYPAAFEAGVDRLPAHMTFNLALGRDAGRNGDKSLGFALDIDNLLSHQYIIKIANGFNTTQIATGRSVLFRLIAPF
ncbi:MAG: TonB-dependent receptor [Vulcanimicrobiaceae bacterium]